MVKFLGEMKIENKYNQNIIKDDLDTGTEYAIKAMKRIKTKHGNKVVITINLKGEVVLILKLRIGNCKNENGNFHINWCVFN